MGVMSESWCFCKGASKSERTKAAIFSTKGPAMAKISGAGAGAGFLIHRNLLLTTHSNLPSVAAAEGSEIQLQNGVVATLVPHRFFISSSVLDLTIVGLDTSDGDSNAHYLKTCSKPNLDLGCSVYLLGYAEKKELTVSEGKVVIGTDNLIKLSTDGTIWSPGSAGFDAQANLAFMICDPMKLASSPNAKSSSTSWSSKDYDFPMQFGIPIPIICDWLNQHWEGSFDELNKPKLPIIRLMSTGHKSDLSSASFTLRQVFKSTEEGNDKTPCSSIRVSKTRDLPETQATHLQGIRTPEIYESPMVTSVPIRKKETAQPPKRQLEEEQGMKLRCVDAEVASSTGSVNGVQSEVQSSSSPIAVSDMHNGYSSEGETMYSAETAESRNYTSPREGKFQQVARSQSCVGYNRWGNVRSNPMARRKIQSQSTMTSQRSNEYCSPTVSSIMKKRNNSAERVPSRPRQITTVQTSPRWNF